MPRLKTSWIAFVAALLLSLPSLSFAQLQTEPLSTVRANIVFPELSPADKRLTAEQAQIFLRDLYVHRFEKLAFYRNLADPVPAIANVVANIDTMTTAEMEEAIYRIFVAQRDLHLNYTFLPPYSNFQTFIPLTFNRTTRPDEFFEVRVTAVNAEQFQQFAPNQRVPEVGDKVMRYDRLPIRQAVRRQQQTAQGANRFGGFSRALDQMTFIPHFLHLVPANDTLEIMLWSDRTRSNYTITIPWLTQFPEGAVNGAGATNTTDAAPAPLNGARFKPEMTQGVDLFQPLFNDFCVRNNLLPRSMYPSNASNEPTLTWGAHLRTNSESSAIFG